METKPTEVREESAIRVFPDHAEIDLGNGEWSLIDVEDIPLVKGVVWYLDSNGYVRTKHPRLHNHLLRPRPGFVVDHRFGNRLDHRRRNLRYATHAQNSLNRGPTNGFKFKGTAFNYARAIKEKKAWSATITVGRERYHLGYFDTEEEAAIAYDEGARYLHGEFGRLNFP